MHPAGSSEINNCFSGHPLSFQANMRIEAYAFGCKGSATFLNGQEKRALYFVRIAMKHKENEQTKTVIAHVCGERRT